MNAESLGSSWIYDKNPRLEYFKTDSTLGNLTLKDMPGKDLTRISNMQRKEIYLRPDSLSQKTLKLKFESVDTAEL